MQKTNKQKNKINAPSSLPAFAWPQQLTQEVEYLLQRQGAVCQQIKHKKSKMTIIIIIMYMYCKYM